jgi:hypothetical protein
MAWQAAAPTDNPTAPAKQAWTDSLPWATVVEVTRMPGTSPAEQLAAAQAMLLAKGGGVAYFPAGTYRFADSIKLLPGVILRGAPPVIASAKNEKFALGTQFEFPKYEPILEGDGTPIAKAFHGIYAASPDAAGIGVVHVAINRGHIHFADAGPEKKFAAGANRFVYGCILRNCAVADPAIPNLANGQKTWQRFTARHFAAVDVKADSNLLIANNRLPKSGDDNFTMPGYVLLDSKKKPVQAEVLFDYDNRPAFYINHYALGGQGGTGPDGTPESHPHGFRKGTVIADNVIFNTGRMGIGFSGDGVVCAGNVIRFPEEYYRPTATGLVVTMGSSTNDNRAIEMRGWRWIVKDNDYTVHRNVAFDKKYKINDGEGLMHEDHVNSIVKDSVLTGNRGNTYLSIYKTAGIDGLLIEANDIRLGDGKQTIAKGAAIMASANRTKDKFPCKNCKIVNNTVAGGGIVIAGTPGEGNVVKGNQCVSTGVAKIVNEANAMCDGNVNFEWA